MSTRHGTAPVGRLIPATDVAWAVQIFSSDDLGAFATVEALLAVALDGETVVVQHSDDGASSFVIVETRSAAEIVQAARVAVLTAAPDATCESIHPAVAVAAA